MTDKTNLLRETHEKYKHLDVLLSDKEFLSSTPCGLLLFEFWKTIKEIAEEDAGENEKPFLEKMNLG